MKKNYVFFIFVVSCGVAGSIFAGEASSSRRLLSRERIELFDAARRGDSARINELLRTNIFAVDAVDESGWTPLMVAAYQGHYEAVYELGVFGTLVDAVNKKGETALMIASKKGYDDIVRRLLFKFANVDVVNNEGKTALDLAANPAVANELKKHGAFSLESLVSALSSDEIERVGPTRVLLAVSSRKDVKAIALADKAIRLKADVCAKNAAGDTALTLAVKADNVEMAKLLLDKMGWKGTDAGGRVGIGDAQPCLSLAEFRAVQSLAKDLEIQKLFAVKMSKITKAFLNAAGTGNIEVLSKLRDAGIGANAGNDGGETALMWAAAAGQVDAVKWLLYVARAAVNARALDGNTALIAAVLSIKEGSSAFDAIDAIFDQLMRYKADINIVNKRGKTALDVALEADPAAPHIVELLKERGALTGRELRARAAALGGSSSH